MWLEGYCGFNLLVKIVVNGGIRLPKESEVFYHPFVMRDSSCITENQDFLAEVVVMGKVRP